MNQLNGSELDGLFAPETLLFSSNDFHQITHEVGRVFKPHRLRMYGKSAALNTSMHHVHHRSFSVALLEYGADVEIDPDRLDDFYLVQIPIRGTADIACGNSRFHSSPDAASLVSPTLPLNMRWFAGNAQLCVRFDRDFVERHAASHLGHPLNRPLEFNPKLTFDTPASQYFLRLLGLFVGEMIRVRSVGDRSQSLMRERLGEDFAAALLNALLYSQEHNWSDDLRRPVSSIAPHFVRRAEDYAREHFREAVTVEKLAEVAGVSVRSLFSGFRDFRDTTPMAYLKELRLQQARKSLLAVTGSNTAQVTHIALECGFSHLGRFAGSYRTRFGESPSATARFKLDQSRRGS